MPLMAVMDAARSEVAAGIMKDAIDLPPAVREFQSPNGKFVLTLSNSDNWTTRFVCAQFDAVSGPSRRRLWKQVLPHEHGPRQVYLTDAGAVVLIDEWINIPSRHALMLIDHNGQTLAHQSLDALIRILGVQRQAITVHARLGVWLMAHPVISTNGAVMSIPVENRSLDLKLTTGHLVLEP